MTDKSLNQSQMEFWNSQGAVGQYTFSSKPPFLFPPELRLLGLFRDRWPSVRMLDIGVGAGRTAHYFAELTPHYVGIDFAPNMVEACQRRFAGRWPGAVFAVGDSTQLAGHADNAYDLVLFSFNGIDSMTYEERLRTLAEMKRVCKPGGRIVFSSHNFYCIPRIPKFRFKAHPVRLKEEIGRWRQVQRRNPPVNEVMAGPHAVYDDGNTGENYLVFTRPEVQAAYLRDMGLEVTGLYANDGHELRTEEDGRDPRVSWVYYYCRKGE